MTPEEFRQQFMKLRGLSIDSTPIVPTSVSTVPVQPTNEVRTVIVPSPGGGPTDPNALPHRLNPYGPPKAPPSDIPDTPAVRSAVAAPAVLPAVPAKPPAPFPTTPVDPVPNVPQATGPAGITLNSAPIAPGWAGTVGIPASPEAAQAYDAGKNNEKIMGGLDEIAKGLHPKAQQVQVPNLLAGAPEPNQANQMAAQLMAAMVNRNRGLTLTGR
jgi:hypothetical protein